jgi:hypothetical protein
MTEKEFISKIRELSQIKPRKDWVVFAKREILGEEPNLREQFSDILEIFPRIVFQRKFAYAFSVILLVLIGTFGFAQNTVPGDLLFPMKKITEKTQAVFIAEKAKYDLEVANKRLEDLTKIAQTNRVKNIAPAISEFQASVSEAAKNLVKEETKKDSETIKKIALEVKKLEENKQKVESLGIVIEESEELDNALAQIIEREIENLENSTLTEEQEKLLEEAKEEYNKGDYSEALIKVLYISNL